MTSTVYEFWHDSCACLSTRLPVRLSLSIAVLLFMAPHGTAVLETIEQWGYDGALHQRLSGKSVAIEDVESDWPPLSMNWSRRGQWNHSLSVEELHRKSGSRISMANDRGSEPELRLLQEVMVKGPRGEAAVHQLGGSEKWAGLGSSNTRWTARLMPRPWLRWSNGSGRPRRRSNSWQQGESMLVLGRNASTKTERSTLAERTDPTVSPQLNGFELSTRAPLMR